MRVSDVLAGEHAFFLADLLRTVNDLYSASAARSDRLKDPEGVRVALSLCQERLVVFLDQVASGRNGKVLGKLGAHARHIAPEQVLTAKLA